MGIMTEKEIIKEKVIRAWERTKDETGDEMTKKIRLIQWLVLDNLWCELYDEEY